MKTEIVHSRIRKTMENTVSQFIYVEAGRYKSSRCQRTSIVPRVERRIKTNEVYILIWECYIVIQNIHTIFGIYCSIHLLFASPRLDSLFKADQAHIKHMLVLPDLA